MRRVGGCNAVPFVVIQVFVPPNLLVLYIHVDPGSVFSSQAHRHSLGTSWSNEHKITITKRNSLFANLATHPHCPRARQDVGGDVF